MAWIILVKPPQGDLLRHFQGTKRTCARADVLDREGRPPSLQALTLRLSAELTALRLTIPGTLRSEIRDGSHSLRRRLESSDDPCQAVAGPWSIGLSFRRLLHQNLQLTASSSAHHANRMLSMYFPLYLRTERFNLVDLGVRANEEKGFHGHDRSDTRTTMRGA